MALTIAQLTSSSNQTFESKTRLRDGERSGPGSNNFTIPKPAGAAGGTNTYDSNNDRRNAIGNGTLNTGDTGVSLEDAVRVSISTAPLPQASKQETKKQESSSESSKPRSSIQNEIIDEQKSARNSEQKKVEKNPEPAQKEATLAVKEKTEAPMRERVQNEIIAAQKREAAPAPKKPEPEAVKSEEKPVAKPDPRQQKVESLVDKLASQVPPPAAESGDGSEKVDTEAAKKKKAELVSFYSKNDDRASRLETLVKNTEA